MPESGDRWWERVEPIPYPDFTSGSYILHFDKPVPYEKSKLYGDGQHYIGASVDIPRRVATHKLGLGSKMTKIAIAEEIPFVLVAVFPTTVGDKPYYVESLLTTIGASSYCPICNEADFLKLKEESPRPGGGKVKGGRKFQELPDKAKINIWKWQERNKK